MSRKNEQLITKTNIMKTKSILIISFLSLIFFGFQFSKNNLEVVYSPLNSGGAGAGKTGAPGESNCTQCHAGSAQDGSNENTIIVMDGSNPVTAYLPGQTYTVMLTMNSAPTKKGFQSTALTGANEMAGDFTGGSNTQINSANSRKYANHTSASNSDATTSWNWSWTAPSANSGDVTFYVASNSANNNFGTSGDAIYLSQHVIGEQSTSSVNELLTPTLNAVSFIPENDEIYVALNAIIQDEIHISVVDLKGNVVYKKSLGTSALGLNTYNVAIPSDMNSGAFVVKLDVNNQQLTKLIQVVR